ncbi:MAG: methylglyoxal synthase [Clostridia bacterium]|jgi:methylglyoxal synthase|nr:methylglyoxal synthase [Clostridia bacterium]MBQ7492635.1 methylglyoxal synthase [Clostridia bacterium]MBR5390361.1 methylglyoxal synthase [Clostridia bacterium]
MNIAIIAQNRKKELMVQFCIAYCGLLAKHELCATATTGKMIMDATGLKIDCLLPGSTGGEQQIAARVSYNEIDMVLFFRDPLEKYQNDAQINDLLRSCDQNCIPVATNVATAEMLIQGLARGDLAWREINPAATF